MGSQPKTLSATEFKAKCQQILDRLEPAGLVITKRGRPIARVMPFVNNSNLIGSLKCEVEVLGDIFSTGEKWRPNPDLPLATSHLRIHGFKRYSILGKGIVSRTWSSPQIHATARSMPMPKPACGTLP